MLCPNGTRTRPSDATGVTRSRKRYFLVENSAVCIITVLYLDHVIFDSYVLCVRTQYVVLVGQTSRSVIARPGATIHEVATNSRFCTH